MQPQQAYVARSRKAEKRDLTQRTLVQAPPHKERALWNFLTWSFFISQVLAAEQFIGAQAKAAEGLDLKASDPTAAVATLPLESLSVVDGTGSATEDVRSSPVGSLDDVFAPPLKLGTFDGSVIDLDSIAEARADDVAQSISVSAYGAAALSNPSSDTPGGLTPDPDLVIDVVVPDVLDVIGDVTSPLLNTVEDIVATLTGIVGSITDPLLGAVGGVVHALDDLVPDVLAPVTSLVADLTHPLDLDNALALPGELLGGAASPVTDTVQDVVGTAGQLVFPLLNLAGLDDLYNNGRYTEYNIELQTGASASSTATSSDPVTSAASAVTDVVDHVVDTATRPLDDAGRHLAHLLDDLGSRDGLL
jgi:hypothetical protein